MWQYCSLQSPIYFSSSHFPSCKNLLPHKSKIKASALLPTWASILLFHALLRQFRNFTSFFDHINFQFLPSCSNWLLHRSKIKTSPFLPTLTPMLLFCVILKPILIFCIIFWWRKFPMSALMFTFFVLLENPTADKNST